MDNKKIPMPGWDDFFPGKQKDDNGGGTDPDLSCSMSLLGS